MNTNNVKPFAIMASLLLALFLWACEDRVLEEIVLEDDPSGFSRSLIIPEAKNLMGDAPESNEFNSLIISKSQASAVVASDNYLFIPFVKSSASELKGVYLQVEGADNYWEIPVEAADPSNPNVEVLSIGVPKNVQSGIFNLNYSMFGGGNTVGNTAQLRTQVVLPEDFCKNGNSLGTLEGHDGISARSYTLGDKRGFVSIQFDTYTVPDRVDIRYNKQWIRSTGSLLNSKAPPIKQCSNVEAGDGFLGINDAFHFFYDPEVSKLVDVYVSGCLEGGTAWEYRIVECPTERPVLGIHSNIDPSGEAEDGHAWISLTQDGKTDYYGLWPDGHPAITDNGAGTDVRKNQEKGFAKYSRFVPLDESQLNRLASRINANKTWSISYNCSSFAQETYQYVVGESIDADELFNGFLIETPRKLSGGITERELNYPTTSYRPEDIGDDSSSCSFCF